MREVDTCNIHPGLDKLGQHSRGVRHWADSAHDLGCNGVGFRCQLLATCSSWRINLFITHSLVSSRRASSPWKDLTEPMVSIGYQWSRRLKAYTTLLR